MNDTDAAEIEVGDDVWFEDYDHSLHCIDCPHGLGETADHALATTLPSGKVIRYAVCGPICYGRLLKRAKKAT